MILYIVWALQSYGYLFHNIELYLPVSLFILALGFNILSFVNTLAIWNADKPSHASLKILFTIADVSKSITKWCLSVGSLIYPYGA